MFYFFFCFILNFIFEQVKENAAWALGYIGKHSEHMAGLVVDSGTLPLLVLAFQEPEMSLKQVPNEYFS